MQNLRHSLQHISHSHIYNIRYEQEKLDSYIKANRYLITKGTRLLQRCQQSLPLPQLRLLPKKLQAIVFQLQRLESQHH